MPRTRIACFLLSLLAACGSEPPPFELTVRVEAATGGTVGFGTSAVLEIPSGALASDAEVRIESRPAQSLEDRSREVAGSVWHFRIDDHEHHAFAKPVTIRVPYDRELAAGASLELSHWSGARWETVPGAVNDEAAGFLQASVTSFSAYAATKPTNQGTGSARQGAAAGTGAGKASSQPAFVSAVAQLGYRKRGLHVPKKGAAASLYFDVPFAVHLPIEVPYDGGAARIHVSIAAEIDARIREAHPDVKLQTQAFGIYRMDGKPMPAGSKASTRYGNTRDLVLYDDQFPVWSHPCSRDDPSPETLPIPFVEGAHAPFPAQSEGLGAFALDPVEPGWYAVWFTVWLLEDFERSWPAGQQAADSIAMKLRCDAIVSRGVDPLADEEIEFLAGRSGKDPGAQRARAVAFELPLALRRNAWEFQRAEVRELPAKPYSRQPAHRVKLEPSMSGTTANLRVVNELFDREERTPEPGETLEPRKRLGLEVAEWKIEFPARIADCGYGDVLIGGKRVAQSDDPKKTGEEVFAWPVELRFATAEPEWLFTNRLPVTWKGKDLLISRPIFQPTYDGEPLEMPNGVPCEPEWRFGQKEKWWPDPGEPWRFRHLTFDLLDYDPVFHVEDIGEFPLLNYRAGPFDVDAYYRRTNDLEGRTGGSSTSPGGVTAVDEKDPYWAWFAGFDKELRKNLADVRIAQAETFATSIPLASFRRLNAMFEEQLADPEEPIPRAKVSEYRQAIALHETNIQVCVALLEVSQRKAEGAYAAILGDLEKGRLAHGTDHPLLHKWLHIYEEEAQRVPLDLARMSGERAALEKALEASTTQAGSARFRKYEAQLKREIGDYVGALASVRSALNVDSTDWEAHILRRDLELVFLQTAMTKSQGAIKEHREKFFEYLKDRGFKESDVKLSIWVRALTGFQDPEVAWATLTTGIGGIVTALGGRPASEEENLAVTVNSMTSAYRGLWALKLLMQKFDLTLDAIAHRPSSPTGTPVLKLTSDEILYLLPLRNTRGVPYTQEQAHALAVDINAALALPELVALVGEDDLGLRLGIDRGYWNPKDVGDTWAEWVGDLTSVKNLIMMLLPMSTSTGGYMSAAGYWGAGSAEAVAALRASGQMVSGTEHVARMIGWTRAIEYLGSGPVGAHCLDMLKGLDAFEKGMGTKTLVGWTIGKFLGSMIFQGVAVYQADKRGGPVAAVLAEAVLMFGMDTDLMLKCLRAAHIEPAGVARVLTQKVVPALEARAKEVNKRKVITEKIKSTLADRQKKGPVTGQPVDPDVAGLPDPVEFVPGESASDNLIHPLSEAKKQVQSGADDGAIDCADAIADDVPAESMELSASAAQAKAVAKTLESQPSPGPVSVKFDPNIEARSPGRMMNRPIPPDVKPGSAVAEAEVLLREGRYGRAKRQLEKLLERIKAGDPLAADELPEYLVRLKINLADELMTLPKRTRPTGKPGFTKEILEEEMEAALKLPPDPDPLHQGAMSDTYAAGDYVVKKLRPVNSKGHRLEPDDIFQMAEEELLNSEIAREVGMNVPGAACKILRDEAGNVIGADIVFRRVKGKPMHELTPGQVFQCHAELSEHQALRVLRGDYDGKLDNYMLTDDGYVVAIDAGMGDCRAKRSGPNMVDHQYNMEGLAGRDHWYTRFFRDPKTDSGMQTLGPDHPDFEFFRKGMVAEESLTYNAAEETVGVLEKFVGNEKRLRTTLDRAFDRVYRVDELRKAVKAAVDSGDEAAIKAAREEFSSALLLKEEAVKEASGVLAKKAKRLDEVMRGINERNGVPLPPPKPPKTGYVPRPWRLVERPRLALAA